MIQCNLIHCKLVGAVTLILSCYRVCCIKELEDDKLGQIIKLPFVD